MAGPARKDKDKETGMRQEWKDRQSRQKMMNIVKAFIGVIVLGVLVGLGIVFKEQIKAFFAKPEPPKVAVKPPEVVAPPPVVEKKIEAPPPVKPPPVVTETKTVAPKPPPEVIPTGEEEVAKKLLAEGRSALEAFEWEKARTIFKDAVAKKSGKQLRADANTWLAKATAFEVATKHIPVSDFAKAETTYILRTHDGREWRGILLKEDDQQFDMQVVSQSNPAITGRQRIAIPKVEIKDRVPVSAAERREEFLQLLGALESGATVQRSTDYYDMVYLSKRLKMGRECIEYLNRAYDGGEGHPADPFLGDSFRKEVIRRAIDRASLMLASGRPKRYVDSVLEDLKKTLPDYGVAADEVDAFRAQIMSKVRDDFKTTLKEVKKQEPPPVAMTSPKKDPSKPAAPPAQSAREMTEEVIEVVVENAGVVGNGAAGPLVERANAKYEEGMKLFRGFRQGTNANNNKLLKSALILLDEAIDLYDQAQQKDPGNKAISDRATEASMSAYSCRKYQTL